MDNPAFTLASARVAIIGLGLMGGSLALALKDKCRAIVGADPDDSTRALARALGVTCYPDLGAALDGCDLLILATPVRTILSQLQLLSQLPSPNYQLPIPLLDLGSTKTLITSAMSQLPAHFDPLGGHPMCGKETSGLAHADPHLFRDRAFILTPLARTSPTALGLAHELIAAIGARPLLLTPERHDALAALASHLPYAVAVTLMHTVLAADPEMWTLAASGFRDTSRLAASDLTMMTDILLTNRTAILDSLMHYRSHLDTLITLLDTADPTTLRAALAAAQTNRAQRFK